MPPRHPTSRRTTSSDRSAELISRALAHVDAHLDQRLDAPTLADQAAMSRHHFHRVFLAHVGCSVASYVTWRRLQRACALLASGREPVLEVALAVGYESAQALAKAMRRELDTTPTAVRRGDSAPWTSLLTPTRLNPALQRHPGEPLTMNITRFAQLPPGLVALTATARGMVNRSMSRAATATFEELAAATVPTGLIQQVRSCISIVPDEPQGPDDPHCRYVGGYIFGYDMGTDTGRCEQPEVSLSGSLAWQALVPGRYAVFTHIGPYTMLHEQWTAIYRDWLPTSGEVLLDAPSMELCVNTPSNSPPEKLHTEIWIPLAPR